MFCIKYNVFVQISSTTFLIHKANVTLFNFKALWFNIYQHIFVFKLQIYLKNPLFPLLYSIYIHLFYKTFDSRAHRFNFQGQNHSVDLHNSIENVAKSVSARASLFIIFSLGPSLCFRHNIVYSIILISFAFYFIYMAYVAY